MMRLRYLAVCLAVLLGAAPARAQISATFLQTADDEADGTTYTYASQDLGAAAADRYITVVATGRKSGASGCFQPSAVSVGGVSATLIVAEANSAGCHTVGIYKAHVPTGGTGDVVLTYGATQLRTHIALYRSTGAQQLVAAGTGSSEADDPTGTLTIAANGYAIGAAVTSVAATTTWAGLTELYDAASGESATLQHTGAMLTPSTLQAGLTITASFTTELESAGVWAAWNIGATSRSLLLMGCCE